MLQYPRIFLSAGEHSGDVLGAGLAGALMRLAPDARLSGVGGPRMAAAGVNILADTTAHAGMGILYVARHMGDWARVYRLCASAFNREPPDVIVPIDNPAFNLGKGPFDGICGLARKRRIPVCYYVSPQIWAWWPWRIRRIVRRVDRMMVILPFEKALYERQGVDCIHVGHPMLDYLASPPLDGSLVADLRSGPQPAIGLLPGSRRQEILHTFPIICRAARLISEALPRARFSVAAAAPEHVLEIRRVLGESGLAAEIYLSRTREIMAASRLCLVVSGTATLETAYYRTPMVIVYRTAGWHRFFVRYFLDVRHIGLVNIVAGDSDAVPEFLKFDDDPAPVASAALRLLHDEREWSACRERLDGVVRALGEPGGFERAARAVLQMVGR